MRLSISYMRHLQSKTDKNHPPCVAIFVDSTSQWGREILFGVNDYSKEHGPWNLHVESYLGDNHVQIPDRWTGDGIIARIHSESFAKALESIRVPIVNVSNIQLKKAIFPRVTNDLQAAARLAFDHFRERGFVHFGYYSLLARPYVSVHRASFARAVQKEQYLFSDLSSNLATTRLPEWNPINRKLSEWIHQLPKPIGILTWNAESAREILNICRLESISVPDQVSVMSGTYDDVLCELSEIPISGIQVEARQIGYKAAVELHRLFQKKSPQNQEPILIPPTRIITRRSTETFNIADLPMMKAITFFRENLSQAISILDAARFAGVSRRVLERRFRATLKRSPAEELKRLRHERAKQLLIESDLSLSQIAESAGFRSPSHFGSQFRALSGETPHEFRTRHRHLRKREKYR